MSKSGKDASPSRRLLRHVNTLNNLKTVSDDEWRQLSKFFSTVKQELLSYPKIESNSILLDAMDGIEHILETTDQEQEQPMPESIELNQALARLSIYDNNGILDHSQDSEHSLETSSQEWMAPVSEAALATVNPIRKIVDQLDMSRVTPHKKFLSVSIGDPTKYPSLPPCSQATSSLLTIVQNGLHNGYAPSSGLPVAKAALVLKYEKYQTSFKSDITHKLDQSDVFLACGCSDALNMSIAALCNRDDILLIPQPGFTLYEVICQRYGITFKSYRCRPDANWEIDLTHLEQLICGTDSSPSSACDGARDGARGNCRDGMKLIIKDGGKQVKQRKDPRVRAILVNNPSNPCGSVLSEENLRGVLRLAEKYKVPIIADEVYEGMTFNGAKFVSLGGLTREVPVLMVSGLAKMYLVPGWRCGWVVMFDPAGTGTNVRAALENLSALILGPHTCVQAALSSIFEKTPEQYYDEVNQVLQRQSKMFYDGFEDIFGLSPVKANGAMYLLTRIETEKFDKKVVRDDVTFANKLLEEQAVLVLPGSIFGAKNYFRTVVLPPQEVIEEIVQRVRLFCEKYVVHREQRREE